MRIIFACDYGYRKVIRVVANHQEPEWVHEGEGAHTDATAVNAMGAPEAGLMAGTECHACRHNWVVREFTWTGAEQYRMDLKNPRLKTAGELRAEIQRRLVPPAPPQDMPALVGQDL